MYLDHFPLIPPCVSFQMHHTSNLTHSQLSVLYIMCMLHIREMNVPYIITRVTYIQNNCHICIIYVICLSCIWYIWGLCMLKYAKCVYIHIYAHTQLCLNVLPVHSWIQVNLTECSQRTRSHTLKILTIFYKKSATIHSSSARVVGSWALSHTLLMLEYLLTCSCGRLVQESRTAVSEGVLWFFQVKWNFVHSGSPRCPSLTMYCYLFSAMVPKLWW